MRQTDFVILGLLSEAPLTGYEIKRIIDLRFRFFWSESFGQIYPRLKDLEKRGLIAKNESEAPWNRVRTPYRILPAGMTALRDWLERPVERETVRLEILLKMYFANLTSADTMLRHIAVFQDEHERDLQLIRHAGRELESIVEQDPNHLYILKVVDFGERVNEAYIRWSRATIDFLKGRKNP